MRETNIESSSQDPQNNVGWLLFLVTGCIVMYILTSCKHSECMAVETVITDTVTEVKVEESIKYRDVIKDNYIMVNTLGDTVRERYNVYVSVHDTIRKTDTLTVYKNRDKETKKEATEKKKKFPWKHLLITVLVVTVLVLTIKTIKK